MKLSRHLVVSLICLISYFQLGLVVDSTTLKCFNNKIKVDPTSGIFQVILVDRVKVIEIAKEHGLDSALNILGYNTGCGSKIGFYDRNLLNDLFALVPGSNPSESILCFLNEFYLYPEFDKAKFKTIYTDYLNSWIKNDSSIPLEPYAFETCLTIMLDYGDTEMQYLINTCFRYWVKRANNYKNQIDVTKESSYYDSYYYTQACEKVYLSQYVLKKLKSTYFNAKEFDYYSTTMTVDYKIPDMSLDLFTNFSSQKFGMEAEKLKIKKSLNSLNDLFLFSLTELCTLFNLKKDDTCNNYVTIFVNKNIGLILDISDCDEDECFKCHQFGSKHEIEFINKNSINLHFVASWY